jgi:hypothetical protein
LPNTMPSPISIMMIVIIPSENRRR